MMVQRNRSVQYRGMAWMLNVLTMTLRMLLRAHYMGNVGNWRWALMWRLMAMAMVHSPEQPKSVSYIGIVGLRSGRGLGASSRN